MRDPRHQDPAERTVGVMAVKLIALGLLISSIVQLPIHLVTSPSYTRILVTQRTTGGNAYEVHFLIVSVTVTIVYWLILYTVLTRTPGIARAVGLAAIQTVEQPMRLRELYPLCVQLIGIYYMLGSIGGIASVLSRPPLMDAENLSIMLPGLIASLLREIVIGIGALVFIFGSRFVARRALPEPATGLQSDTV